MLEKALFPVDFSSPAAAARVFLKGLKPSGLEQVVLVHVIDARGVEYPVMQSHRQSKDSRILGAQDSSEKYGRNQAIVSSVRKFKP